jgi:hypothetical protein
LGQRFPGGHRPSGTRLRQTLYPIESVRSGIEGYDFLPEAIAILEQPLFLNRCKWNENGRRHGKRNGDEQSQTSPT